MNSRLSNRHFRAPWAVAVGGFLLCLAGFIPSRAVALAPVATPAPSTLTVAMDDNYPPYIFRDSNGTLVGYLVDYWSLWERKTGVRVDLQASDWDLAKTRMQTHQAQVIDTIFQTKKKKNAGLHSRLCPDPGIHLYPFRNWRHCQPGPSAGVSGGRQGG